MSGPKSQTLAAPSNLQAWQSKPNELQCVLQKATVGSGFNRWSKLIRVETFCGDPALRRPVDNSEVLHHPDSNFRASKQMETKTMQRNLSQQTNTEAQQIEQNQKLLFYILSLRLRFRTHFNPQ